MDQLTAIQEQARLYQKQLGGEIFAFPVEEENPHSLYAVVVYAGDKFHVFSEAVTIEEAGVGIHTILDSFEKEGIKKDYKTAVRFMTGEPQLNAPNVTMRRLKKKQTVVSSDNNSDFINQNGEYLLSARGVLIFSYLSMVDEQLPKAIQFMNKYYRTLAARGYGKSAAGIKKEVNRMDKDQAVNWLKQTFDKYLGNGDEVIRIMHSLK
ncbi:hypothetical protein ACIGHG_22945 [Bacillus sp. NPDC077411]|uniref:hypothetical protein n=1 Tax=Bacillus sp. NPDC077411 TaxID=3363947 RepID=UPI0037CBDA50